ncbi:MAG: LLM class flavin-dependent oxidoreductase [Candidatus Kariarchaeaceae archaeon]
MKFGVDIGNYGAFSDPDYLKKFAHLVEESGWDGLFIWDHLQLFPEYFRGVPFIDPWIGLSIIAMNTTKIKLGPYITPLSRRRPWQVYRQVVSLDHLSKGRVMFGVGLGTPAEFDMGAFGDATDDKLRAELLDESLDIIQELSTGEIINFNGKHYHLKQVQLLPKPYQERIPIIVGGEWPNKPPFRRAARYQGVVPISNNWPNRLSPEDIIKIQVYIAKHRTLKEPIEVTLGGSTPVDQSEAKKIIQPYKDVGLSWWLEDIDGIHGPFDQLIERVKAGPPDLDD